MLIIAVGGMFYPYLGWGMPPMMILLIFISLFRGRYWCGNICPRGSFFDTIVKKISYNKSIHKIFTNNVFRVTILVLFFALVGYRLFNVFQGEDIYAKLGLVFASLCLVSTIIGLVLGTMFAPRTWCSFCPMGTVQQWLGSAHIIKPISKDKSSKKIILDPQKCIKCATCARVCPMQLEPLKEAQNTNVVDHPDCIQCKTCIDNCPMEALSYSYARPNKKENTTGEWAEITGTKKLHNAKQFTLKVNNLKVQPGQSVILRVSRAPQVFRAYSVVWAKNKSIAITLKPVNDGLASSYIYSLKKGDKVYVEGPKGNMLLGNSKNKYFVGVGIGITPFVWMAEEALKTGYNVTLLHGAKTEKELYYQGYFQKIQRKFNNFRYIPTVTRQTSTNVNKGRVTHQLGRLNLDKDAEFYICGMKDLVSHTEDILYNKGVHPNNVKYEAI